MNGSRTGARSRIRPQGRWLNGIVALLFALTAAVMGQGPASFGVQDAQAGKKKLVIDCCTGVETPESDEFHVEGSRLFYHPEHEGGTVTIQVRIEKKSTVILTAVTFPTIFGVAGGPGEQSYEDPAVWERTYAIPEGAQDTGEKEIRAAGTLNGAEIGAGTLLSVIADVTYPEVEITSPGTAPVTVEIGKKVAIKASAGDVPGPRTQPSGIESVEFYVGDIDDEDNEPFFVDTEAPYRATFTALEGPHVITALAWDNVGNGATSNSVTVCGGSCDEPGPPPPSGVPDEWTDAQPVTSLPFRQEFDTEDLDSSPDDPTCRFPNGVVSDYESSAWFRINLPYDAQVNVTTVESEFDDGDPKDYDEELDTILMIMVRNGNQWSVMQCVDDIHNPDDPSGDSDQLEAELTIGLRGGDDYYVMAGVLRYPPGEEEVGTLVVQMREA